MQTCFGHKQLVTSANEVAVKTYNNTTATSTEIPSTKTLTVPFGASGYTSNWGKY
ncbi:MAG: hypothetical protein IKV46_00245 [Bacteroidales bacterium]|nr:hypothetical protein [Bacteroidales bacterium]